MRTHSQTHSDSSTSRTGSAGRTGNTNKLVVLAIPVMLVLHVLIVRVKVTTGKDASLSRKHPHVFLCLERFFFGLLEQYVKASN
jgi:hypothetical protein